ncbi:uncharacterized protein BXZ73DRAFT_97009 [Epithele typhae]|uniref:uncharacterized protein n=1 Tax=Epithele typhae TaxID=378194 RepID=UPI002008C6F2|nr:uncharacterized protein BXZ73DRAFT_97009 [Epithele typhae]KAH9944524.1 hypothetical protein BXZ73DRAFT_97009 [Epithele typhae]
MSDFGLSDVNMDATTKKELQTFLEAEQAQQRVQENIHSLTNMCWDKYVVFLPPRPAIRAISTLFSSFAPSPIHFLAAATRFLAPSAPKPERDCLHNCVGRFLDTSSFIIAKVQEKRSSAGVSS